MNNRIANAEMRAESAGNRTPPDTAATPRATGASVGQSVALNGVSVADAMASVGSRNNLVTSIVMSENSNIAQIRVVDAVTHQVIAESPPDSIARMQDEMLAYQQVARSSRQS